MKRRVALASRVQRRVSATGIGFAPAVATRALSIIASDGIGGWEKREGGGGEGFAREQNVKREYSNGRTQKRESAYNCSRMNGQRRGAHAALGRSEVK